MQMKSPNDLLTCLVWFVLHHLPHGVKAGGTFIGYENEVRGFLLGFFQKAYFGDKMMDVIFILEPICSAMHE